VVIFDRANKSPSIAQSYAMLMQHPIWNLRVVADLSNETLDFLRQDIKSIGIDLSQP
jgi:hypothetical protein